MTILGLRLGESLHDLGVELGHQDLDGLIRLRVDPAGQEPVERVKGVEVPAVTENGMTAVKIEGPGPNVIKLFCPRFTNFLTKLECVLD